MSDSTEAARAIEAVVMASPEPVAPDLLAQLVEIPTAAVEEICDRLAAEYERDGRGFVLVRVAGGYRYQTHPDLAPYVERFVLEGQHARLSPAALETLAIVAYKQPIGRAQLSAIRGVNVDATLRTLVATATSKRSTMSPRPGTRPVSARRAASSNGSASGALGDLPALGDFVPGRASSKRSSGLRVPDDLGPGATVDLPTTESATGIVSTTAPDA